MDQEVEYVLPGYPPPSPPEKSPDQIFNHKDFCDIDNRARQAPESLVHDFDQLMTYLQEGATSDLAKVRSIFIWLSAQPVLSTNFPGTVVPDTPQAWLKKIKYDRSYYAELFAIMCRKAGVPCVIISGCSKGAGFEVGQPGQLKETSRWNAVHVQGDWQLVNVSWALIIVDGLAEGEWIALEVDGQVVGEPEVAKKEVTQELDEFWFLVRPEHLNAFCHAKNSNWQLLEKPWTDDEFVNTPRFAEDIFTSKWELVTENKGVLQANQGACIITFTHPTEGVEEASLSYVLLYHSAAEPNDPIFEKLGTERYVLVDSKKGEKSLVTRLPKVGSYRVQVAGLLDGAVTYLGEFRIECPSIKKEPPPFPEGCQEIGYTEKAAAAGLETPSHEGGIVQAKPGERINFKFNFAKNKPQPRRFRATLTHNTLPADKLDNCTEIKRTDDDVTLSVKLPKDKANNEFGVCIGASDSTSNDADNQSEEINYDIIMAYIVTQDTNLAFPKEKTIIKNNSDLSKSIKNLDVARFYKLYTSMRNSLDPLQRSMVANFMKVINKLKLEKTRELVEAMNAPDINPLEKALHDYESLVEVNQDTVQQAKATLGLLKALKSEDNVAGLEKALTIMYQVSVIHNSNVQRAEDTLVAFYEKDLTEAYYKRSLDVLNAALATVDKSCVNERVKGQFMFTQVKHLVESLKEMKQVTEKVGRLKAKDLKKIAGPWSSEPHPHVRSVLMATFILLGEKEADLWNWDIVQNLLERRAETGVARAMANLDVDSLTAKQIALAECHIRACQLEVLMAEDPNTALFLKWAQGIVAEKRARDAVKERHKELNNQN